MSENKKYLTPKELAERWSVSLHTLASWRKCSMGKGPKFVKIGGVLYPLDEVIKYEREQLNKGN